MKPKYLIPSTLAAVIAMSGVTSAATTLIGGTTGNGNFQANFTNYTEAQDWGVTGTEPDNDPITPTVNALGRAFLGNSQIGAQIQMEDWAGVRVSYPGGNNAWGFDAANAAFGAPNVYIFQNSGSSDYTAATVAHGFSAGDTIWFTADLFSQGSANGSVTVTIDFGNGETHTFTKAQTTASQVLLQHTSAEYTLLADASEVTMSFLLNTEVSGNQTLIDNITLQTVPEPASGLLIMLGSLVLLRRRR